MTADPPIPTGRESAPPKQRRVYKTVSTREEGAAFAIHLDGKPARTPLRHPLVAPTRSLAQAVAAEWDAQDPHIDPQTMPLTRLLATSIDRIEQQRQAVIAQLVSYVGADVICYRASHPEDLRTRQRNMWQPVLDWLLREHDIAMTSSEGLMPVSQPPDVALRLGGTLEAMNDARLTVFQACAAATSSLALSLALVSKFLSADEVFAAAFLDEIYQAEKWGEDAAALARRRDIASGIAAMRHYLDLAAG